MQQNAAQREVNQDGRKQIKETYAHLNQITTLSDTLPADVKAEAPLGEKR